MSKSANEFNLGEIGHGSLTVDHVTALTKIAQEKLGLEVDGFCGPKTRDALGPFLHSRTPTSLKIVDGWLHGPDVQLIPADSSWYYANKEMKPQAIVAHYTATPWGTAIAMANNRTDKKKLTDRAASWHVSIENDGTIIQMVPFNRGAWHAGGKTAKPIPGLTKANLCSIGIELVGYGTEFNLPQVASAKALWRTIVQAYGIDRKYAMVQHSELDPTRKKDPGKLWMDSYAPSVCDYAYM